jgi:hypothetical protein
MGKELSMLKRAISGGGSEVEKENTLNLMHYER